jgi:single-stranded DNA-binding protein
MIDVLTQGTLHKAPVQHTAKTGNAFATATIRAATGDGGALFINCIAFDAAAVAALMALDAGDSLAVAGTATPKAWTDKDGNARPSLDVVAAHVLTLYHVNRKRQAMGGGES